MERASHKIGCVTDSSFEGYSEYHFSQVVMFSVEVNDVSENASYAGCWERSTILKKKIKKGCHFLPYSFHHLAPYRWQ